MWEQFKRPARADRFQKKLNREMEEVFIRNAIEFGNMPPRDWRFFLDPAVYVVLLGTGPDGSCGLAADSSSSWTAVLGFLSPVDAHIEGILRAKPGLGYEVRQACRVPEQHFRAENGEWSLSLHLSWVALDGRMLLSPGGEEPCRLSRLVSKEAGEEAPIFFEVDAVALDDADYLYECAGLYAWEHTHKHPPLPVERAAQYALREGHPMRLPLDADRSRLELALFDPEGRNWHYLPRQVAFES
jgi:hypothetical protein